MPGPLSVHTGGTEIPAPKEFRWARKREKGACKIDPTVHAHVFGRPAGMWAFERVMEIARKSKDVWIGTRAEVAAHVRKVLKNP